MTKNFTRRDFIVSASLLAASPALAKPIRSGLAGLGTSVEDAGGWDNSTAKLYIQDGLIAMFDGIENAGWGLHSQTILRDLITGYTFTLPNGDYVVDNHITVASTTGIWFSDCLVPGGELTVECVCSFADNNTQRECAVESGSDNKAFRYKKTQNSLQALWAMTGKSIEFNVGEIEHFAATEKDGSPSLYSNYKNGVLVNFGSMAHTMKGRYAVNGFRIGRNGYTAFGDYYSVRVYDRQLTAEEIAYNFTIDQMRFGL